MDSAVQARAKHKHKRLRKQNLVRLQILLLEPDLLTDVHEALGHAIKYGAGQPNYDPLLPSTAQIRRANLIFAPNI